jgi:hypothetical protein
MLAAARSVSARVKLAVRLASVDTYLMEVAVEPEFGHFLSA